MLLDPKDDFTTDQIIADVRRTKERLAEAMNFDVSRILDDARQKQSSSGRPILPPPARQPSLSRRGQGAAT